MTLPIPEPGLVIGYAYLWRSEYERGQEEGTKDRLCVLVLAARDDDGDMIVIVVPITHALPERPDEAVEIPLPTKRRLGLDAARSWVIVSEVNRFVWPGPDLRPVSRAEPDRFEYGLLPPALFRQIRQRLAACVRTLKAVRQTEQDRPLAESDAAHDQAGAIRRRRGCGIPPEPEMPVQTAACVGG